MIRTYSQFGYVIKERIIMLLRDYKEQNNLTLQELATQIGVTGKNPRQTIRRWVMGARIPRLHYLDKIEIATKGKVKFEDLVNGYKQRQNT